MIVDTAGLSDKHIRALELFIQKFRAGAIQHGDIHTGDWTKESLDETVDLAFYLLFMVLERQHVES